LNLSGTYHANCLLSFQEQDPGTTPARRRWTSLDVGTEIYVSNNEIAEWILSDFDILVPAINRAHGDSIRFM
jgi:hypothetical protein